MIESNIDTFQKIIEDIAERINEGAKIGVFRSVQWIGNRITGKYMIGTARGTGESTNQFRSRLKSRPTDPNRLTHRTGRLSRSYLGAMNWNSTGKISGNESGQGTPESIRQMTESKNGFSLVVGTKVPYAVLHEYGWSGSMNISAHTRKAHTRNGVNVREHGVRSHTRSVSIRPRPHLTPAFEDAINNNIFTLNLQQEITKAMSR